MYKFLLIASFSACVVLLARYGKAIYNSGIFSGNTEDIRGAKASTVPLNNMFGVNAYEWNFLQNPANPNKCLSIYETNMALIKTFSAVRHYMDWEKLEATPGHFTFNPTRSGGWNYDAIYQRCKLDSILILADLKTCPPWLQNTYPQGMRDAENVPAPYGADLSKPAAYILQAKAAFQFAARYGYNKHVNPALLSVDKSPRWTADPPNELKIGMGLVKYLECDNERDKTWKGPATKQTPEEYAANLSAFYDGDQGRLGKNVGVKTADPAMQVVIGGLSQPDVKNVERMIAWCKQHRGLRADGSVNLCFDVINYHCYIGDGNFDLNIARTRGTAPELSNAASIADAFVKLANSLKQHCEVWITENGYDTNEKSPQRAIVIGNKSTRLTQADWSLRSAFLYMRHGIKRLFFYQFFDDGPGNPTQYGTSGLVEGTKRRPAADYMLQTSKLMGNFFYKRTINANPLVDEYQYGKHTIYVLYIPDEKGRTGNFELNVGKSTSAFIYHLIPGADTMDKTDVKTTKGKLSVAVTETPVFVEAR